MGGGEQVTQRRLRRTRCWRVKKTKKAPTDLSVAPSFFEGKVFSELLHQESGTGAFDLTSDLTVKMSCESGHATGKNLAALGCELLEEVWILEINGLGGDVEPTARHATIGAAEIGAALWCLGCAHGLSRLFGNELLGLPMQSVSAKIRIVLLLFETARGIEALLVAGRGVP